MDSLSTKEFSHHQKQDGFEDTSVVSPQTSEWPPLPQLHTEKSRKNKNGDTNLNLYIGQTENKL